MLDRFRDTGARQRGGEHGASAGEHAGQLGRHDQVGDIGALRQQMDVGEPEVNLARAKLNPTPVQLPPGAPPQLAQLFGPARATSDVRSLFRSELRAVQQNAQAAIPRATIRETRAHLEDLRDQNNQLLNPR